MLFTQEELLRYSRHFSLKEIGIEGQQRLKMARVLCVGGGGLGSIAVAYLAAVGIGTVGMIDGDVVDVSNLQRQILFSVEDISHQKTERAKRKLSHLNPHVNVITYPFSLTEDNAFDIFSKYDIILDCSDNVSTRYLVNDVCFHLKKPDIFASISKFDGMITVFCSHSAPCYRCLYSEPPADALIPNCAEAGVLGVLPGFFGILQANETIKIILNKEKLLIGEVLLVNLLSLEFKKLVIEKNQDCILCAQYQPFDKLPRYQPTGCFSKNETIQELSLSVLNELKNKDDVLIVDVREPHEYAVANIGGYLIPLSELMSRVSEINKNRFIVVVCQTGKRSQQAAELLRSQGFQKVAILKNGIS